MMAVFNHMLKHSILIARRGLIFGQTAHVVFRKYTIGELTQ